MRIVHLLLPGLLLIEPVVHRDRRGAFAERWRRDELAAAGLPPFVQENGALSEAGVLRGLHLQTPQMQGKLVSVQQGAVFDVGVDLRRGSSTFGRWQGVELSAANWRQLYVPPGFAHGYVVTDGPAVMTYHCTEYYEPADELRIVWNDPDIGIEWLVTSPLLSDRDAAALRLSDIPLDRLPQFEASLESGRSGMLEVDVPAGSRL